MDMNIPGKLTGLSHTSGWMHEIIFGVGTHNIQLILVLVPTYLVMFPIRHAPRDMQISLSYAESNNALTSHYWNC